MNDIWTVNVEVEWRTTHPYEFDSKEEAQNFFDAAEQGDIDAVLDYGDVRPDHTSELMNLQPVSIKSEII